MGKPKSRPANVHEDAVFVAADDEWELGARRGKKHIGDVTWWRADGSLVCRSHFDDDGELDGTCRRYHPDGSISMESRYVHGVRWGKTWHTRSRSGASPEDVHVAALPEALHRLELVYVEGQPAPLQAYLTRDGADAPPELSMGRLLHFERDIGKYLPGTVFMPFGTILDIADRRVEAHALFFRGVGTTDGTMLRFSLTPEVPPGVEAWQDPNATVVATSAVMDRLVVAVDYLDARITKAAMPKGLGLTLEHGAGEPPGLVVAKAEAKGVGRAMGLRRGDRLVRMAGLDIHCVADYLEATRAWDASGRLTVEVDRNGKRIECTAPTSEG